MVLSGKMELNGVNPFTSTAEGRLISPHHRGNSNYSLQKPKSSQKGCITSCGSCRIGPSWERLAFSFRALRAPLHLLHRATAARVRDGVAGEQGQSSGSLKGLFCFTFYK